MILGIIPARYASTRFPGKPLLDLLGKSMIQRVYEAAQAAAALDEAVVATDDARILEHVQAFDGKALLTADTHLNGTDRCREAADRYAAQTGRRPDYIINIQGDEPLINPEQINELAACLDGTTELATQMSRVATPEQLFSVSEAKIVFNDRREALYFSRQPIPYLRNVPENEWLQHHTFYHHVGLYAYRTDVLMALAALPPSPLEQAEALEQLRWLQAGYRIQLVETHYQSLSIDTPEDLDAVLHQLRAEGR